jgi:CO/xanthine dehydrogenase FAD-binding subunit
VVDLQSVGLNTIQYQGNTLQIGATLTLQSLADTLKNEKLENLAGLQQAITREATYNLRQVGTVAGALVTASGRSPFATAMLALDAQLRLQPDGNQPGDEQVGLGDLLPVRLERLPHRLITLVSIPLNARLAYEYVARSPADVPIVCAAVAIWPSGRTRVALGGFGDSPVLAFDGSEAEGAEIAASDAYSQAGDEWASAEYRQEVAGVLVKRCTSQLIELSA